MSRFIRGLAQFTEYKIEALPQIRLDLPRPFADVLAEVQSLAPTTYPDVVPWMQEAATHNKLLTDFKRTYNEAGGLLRAQSGDPFIPGVSVGDYDVKSVDQSVAGVEGMVVTTGNGTVAVIPLNSKAWTSDKRVIGMFLSRVTDGIQWTGLLAVFEKFAKLPQSGQLIIPTFISQNETPLSLSGVWTYTFIRPSFTQTFNVAINAPVESVIKIRLWDASRNVFVETPDILVPGGETQSVAAIFRVPGMMTGYLEVEPLNAPLGLTIGQISTRPLSV